MGKFDRAAAIRPAATSPVTTTSNVATLRTHEGAPGYARDAKGELFLLAVSNMVGEDTFYEKANDRDARYNALLAQVAVADPRWMAGFLGWLRLGANMRSASLVGGLEAARAMLAANIPGSRAIVNSVLQRADEPGEAIAYWTSRYGRAIPKPVKRGIADGATRLYNEYSLLKYDTSSHTVRFADVLDLTHPTPHSPWQGHLFQYAMDRRHGRDTLIPDALVTIVANDRLRDAAAENPSLLLDANRIKAAGMTWEDVLSLGGKWLEKRALWEAMIPSMGLMALARNLRNFDEAGVSDEVASVVAARFADPEQVAKSRMLPFRWLAAYENAPSLRWGHALEKALEASLANVPELPGRSLVLVDTSGSMTSTGFSAKSKMTPAKAAAVFGVALAKRCEVDLYGFADGRFRHNVPAGASALKEIQRFLHRTGEVGYGTQIGAALQRAYDGHDRVFVISDEQTMDRATDHIPSSVPMYVFNLGGYRTAMTASGANRHSLGGLNDATFAMVPLLERGQNAPWPWEM